MEPEHFFDRLTRSLAARSARRGLLRSLMVLTVPAAVATLVATLGERAGAQPVERLQTRSDDHRQRARRRHHRQDDRQADEDQGDGDGQPGDGGPNDCLPPLATCDPFRANTCCTGKCCLDPKGRDPLAAVCSPPGAMCCDWQHPAYCPAERPICCGRNACCAPGQVCYVEKGILGHCE